MLKKHSVIKNCSTDLKRFSRSLEQFFLTVGQNNFGNKLPFLNLYSYFLKFHSYFHAPTFHELFFKHLCYFKSWLSTYESKKLVVEMQFRKDM